MEFRYPGAEQVLEHLLKSGAGTAFHEAIAPSQRDGLTREFVRLLAARHRGQAQIAVVHEYIAGIARTRPQR